jgi:hypothetical protein
MAMTGLGLGLSVVGWLLARGESSLDEQVQWINLAVGGFVLSCFGLVGWFLRGRRAVGQRCRDLLGEAPVRSLVAVAVVARRSGRLVAGPGRKYFHSDDCLLAADRRWPEASRHDFEAAGLAPCGVCHP